MREADAAQKRVYALLEWRTRSRRAHTTLGLRDLRLLARHVDSRPRRRRAVTVAPRASGMMCVS